MSDIINEKCEALEKQIAQFRKLHKMLQNVITAASVNNRGELACQYFAELTKSSEADLFIFEEKSNRYYLRITTSKNRKNLIGGYIEIDDNYMKLLDQKHLITCNEEKMFLIIDKSQHVYQNRFTIGAILAFSNIYGLLLVENDTLLEINENELELINLFLSQLTPLVEYFIDYQRLLEKTKYLELLYKIGSNLSSIEDEEKLFENILTLIEQYLEIDRCSLMIIDSDGKNLRIKKAIGITEVELNNIKIPIGLGIAGAVASNAQPLLIKDVDEEIKYSNKSQVENKNSFRTKSLLSIPLIAHGKVVGVINVNNRKDGLPFTETDRDLLYNIGSEIALIIHKSYITFKLKKAKELDHDIRRFIV